MVTKFEMRDVLERLSKLEEHVKDIDSDINEICNDLYTDDASVLTEKINNGTFNEFINAAKDLGYCKITIDINNDNNSYEVNLEN